MTGRRSKCLYEKTFAAILRLLPGLTRRSRRAVISSEEKKDRRGKGAAGARRPKLTGHQRKEAIACREAGETLKDLPGPTLLVAFNMTS
jgi:hypothetical protein